MKRIWKILLITVGILFIILVFTQPRKSLEVAVLWTPAYPEFMKAKPEYRPEVHAKEQIVYRIYYAWNGHRDKLPWWIITKSIDNQWRVIEAANSDSYNTMSLDNVIFDKDWSYDGFHCVARTRFEKIRLVLLGTDNFSRERNALSKVIDLIEMQKQFESQGKDLFDSFKAYIDMNPNIASFFPDDRAYWVERFKKMEHL